MGLYNQTRFWMRRTCVVTAPHVLVQSNLCRAMRLEASSVQVNGKSCSVHTLIEWNSMFLAKLHLAQRYVSASTYVSFALRQLPCIFKAVKGFCLYRCQPVMDRPDRRLTFFERSLPSVFNTVSEEWRTTPGKVHHFDQRKLG